MLSTLTFWLFRVIIMAHSGFLLVKKAKGIGAICAGVR